MLYALNTMNNLFCNPLDQCCPVELPAMMKMVYICAAKMVVTRHTCLLIM